LKGKFFKNFSRRPLEYVWGLRENVFPGPAVALDGPIFGFSDSVKLRFGFAIPTIHYFH